MTRSYGLLCSPRKLRTGQLAADPESAPISTYAFGLKFTLAGQMRASGFILEGLRKNDYPAKVYLAPGKRWRVSLEFEVEERSAFLAMSGAIAAVRRAKPGLHFVEALPDLVGLATVADFAGCSRQNLRMRSLMDPTFPLAAHEGHPELFHLIDLLDWARRRRHIPLPRELVDVAAVARELNLARQASGLAGWRSPDRVRELIPG